jgi:thioredoxin 1
MEPLLAELGSRGDVRVVHADVDEAPILAARYGVRSVPTLLLFDDGEPVAARVGRQSRAQLEKLLAERT